MNGYKWTEKGVLSLDTKWKPNRIYSAQWSLQTSNNSSDDEAAAYADGLLVNVRYINCECVIY